MEKRRIAADLKEFVLCPKCVGVGVIRSLQNNPDTGDLEEWTSRCGYCMGMGLKPKAKFCPTCRGKGYLLEEELKKDTYSS